MTKRLLILWCSYYLFSSGLTGCSKQKGFDIGREDPDLEIKKCVSLSQKKRFEEAVECLEIFKSRFPQTAQGQEAELKIADTYYNQHQSLLAADAYQAFVKFNPLHPQVDYAIYRTGLSYFQEAPKAIDRDQQYLIKAAQQMELALQVAPQSIYREAIFRDLKRAHDRLAERLYYIGHFYFRTGEYIAAIPRFQELAERYPKFELAPKALYYLARANLAIGKQENARQAVENLIQNFPKNRWTKNAEEHYLNVVQKKE